MAKDESKKKDEKPDEKPDEKQDKAPEKKGPEEVTFRSTRYPNIAVQVKGKTLRNSIKFEDGAYTTTKKDEIAVLDGLDYAVRDDESK